MEEILLIPCMLPVLTRTGYLTARWLISAAS